MNFNLEMEKRQEKITGILEYYLPKEEGFQKTVLEAMNYSMRVCRYRVHRSALSKSAPSLQTTSPE